MSPSLSQKVVTIKPPLAHCTDNDAGTGIRVRHPSTVVRKVPGSRVRCGTGSCLCRGTHGTSPGRGSAGLFPGLGSTGSFLGGGSTGSCRGGTECSGTGLRSPGGSRLAGWSTSGSSAWRTGAWGCSCTAGSRGCKGSGTVSRGVGSTPVGRRLALEWETVDGVDLLLCNCAPLSYWLPW